MSKVLEERFAEREEKILDHAAAVADKLHAGRYLTGQMIVLKASAIITRYGYLPTCVVLVALANEYTPFVCWYGSFQEGTWQFSSGQYEQTLSGALEAYAERKASWLGRSHEGVIARTN